MKYKYFNNIPKCKIQANIEVCHLLECDDMHVAWQMLQKFQTSFSGPKIIETQEASTK